MHRYMAWAMVAAVAAGCTSNSGGATCQSCTRDSDCRFGGEACRQTVCVPAGFDAARCPNGAAGASGASGAGSTGAASTTGGSGSTASGSGSTASGSTDTGSSTAGTGSSGGSTGSSSTGSSGTTSSCGPSSDGALSIVEGVALTPTAATVGQSISGTVTLQNTLGVPLTVGDLVISYWEPGGTKSSGPWGQIATTGPMVLDGGATFTLQGSYLFTSADPLGTYNAYFTWEDANSNWHDDSCNVPFTVSTGSGSTG